MLVFIHTYPTKAHTHTHASIPFRIQQAKKGDKVIMTCFREEMLIERKEYERAE